LDDPSLTVGESFVRNPQLASVDLTNKFDELIESWQSSNELSESWVEMLEQIVPLVAGSLHHKPGKIFKSFK